MQEGSVYCQAPYGVLFCRNSLQTVKDRGFANGKTKSVYAMKTDD
jgi:hypothetical protein